MSVRWLIGSVGCGLAGGEREGDADDDSRYHLMPRERQFYDAAAEDEEGEREREGREGRRENGAVKMEDVRNFSQMEREGEGGRTRTDKQKLACIRLLFVCFHSSPTPLTLVQIGPIGLS